MMNKLLQQYYLIPCDTSNHSHSLSLSLSLSLSHTHACAHTQTQNYNSIYSCLPGDTILLLLSPFSWTNLLCFHLTFMSAKCSVFSHWNSSLTMWHVTSLLAGHVMCSLSASERRLTDWLLCKSMNFSEARWKAILRQVREEWFTHLAKKVTLGMGMYIGPYTFLLLWRSLVAVVHDDHC